MLLGSEDGVSYAPRHSSEPEKEAAGLLKDAQELWEKLQSALDLLPVLTACDPDHLSEDLQPLARRVQQGAHAQHRCWLHIMGLRAELTRCSCAGHLEQARNKQQSRNALLRQWYASSSTQSGHVAAAD